MPPHAQQREYILCKRLSLSPPSPFPSISHTHTNTRSLSFFMRVHLIVCESCPYFSCVLMCALVICNVQIVYKMYHTYNCNGITIYMRCFCCDANISIHNREIEWKSDMYIACEKNVYGWLQLGNLISLIRFALDVLFFNHILSYYKSFCSCLINLTPY